MTHFLQRSALILLASTALCATPSLARTHHARKPAAQAEQAERASYTVKKGDTLASIADKLDTTVEQLRKDNRLRKTSLLRPGQVLKGPVVLKASSKAAGGREAGGKAAAAKSYTVVHGDTLFSISQRLHVPVEDLRAANRLSRKAQIHAGQELRLPGAADAEAERVPAKAEARGPRGRKAQVAAAEPVDETPASGAAGGRVVTVQARGETYKARKGDTLAKIAGRLGVGVSQLKRLNHIRGSAVHAGQIYHGAAFAEHIYTAAPGDTVPSIAQRFGVSVASLRAENEFSRRVVSVRPGQKVYLPDGYRDSSTPAVERPSHGYSQPFQPPRGETTQLPSHPIPYAPSGGSATQTPPAQAPSATPGPTDAQISQLGKDRFKWPLTGTILSDFGPKTGGQRNDGINIQADTGAPVHAAADGEVIYAGDQVPGFGNLILLKHADGWATVYAHLSKVEVKAQQKVTQGQEIGQAGSSGGVPEPQLHFEVRYTPTPAERARSVDPKLVLPK
jgi:murein DD-endopeptidase MepM/ murein hydrolase activator NlpD